MLHFRQSCLVNVKACTANITGVFACTKCEPKRLHWCAANPVPSGLQRLSGAMLHSDSPTLRVQSSAEPISETPSCAGSATQHTHIVQRGRGLSPSRMLRLRGGVSKYYNETAPSRRGGIFETPNAGVAPVSSHPSALCKPVLETRVLWNSRIQICTKREVTTKPFPLWPISRRNCICTIGFFLHPRLLMASSFLHEGDKLS